MICALLLLALVLWLMAEATRPRPRGYQPRRTGKKPGPPPRGPGAGS